MFKLAAKGNDRFYLLVLTIVSIKLNHDRYIYLMLKHVESQDNQCPSIVYTYLLKMMSNMADILMTQKYFRLHSWIEAL